MKKSALLFASSGIVLASAMALPLAASVKIMGVNVAKNDICPNASTSKCVQDSTSSPGTYVYKDKRFVLIEGGKPKYSEYIGRVYTAALNKHEAFCTGTTGNLLEAYAASKGIPYLQVTQQNSVKFTMKAKKLVDVGVGLDPIAIATSAGVPAADIAGVSAAIKTAYKRASSKDVAINGIYQFVEVNTDVITALSAVDAPAEMRACAEWLKTNNKQLVVSLTGFQLKDAAVTNELKTKFSTELKAGVEAPLTSSQLGSIEAAFSSEIEKKAELQFDPTFQLLSVGRYSVG